jgi:phage tail sheath protein FI
MSELMAGLLRAGALRGATPEAAFDVRCDRSTMSQSDIDSGRVIARIQFDAALPIEQITVVLALGGAGVTSLGGAQGQEAVRG